MKFLNDYESVEELLIDNLNSFKHGELTPWCEKHNLPFKEVSRFKKRTLKTTRSFFLKQLLEAFGYKNVKVSTKIMYSYEKDDDIKE